LLRGFGPLLGADLLYVLAATGHGDEIAIVDRNFPAVSQSRRVVRMRGANVVAVGWAIPKVLPLGTFVPAPVAPMRVIDRPDEVPGVQSEFLKACEESEDRPIHMVGLVREEFYSRAREAFAVVVTSERRPYGCFVLTKGVVNEPARLTEG
jgi:L-fucose mutarotase